MINPESFEEKLYILRDAEGKSNEKKIKWIREYEEEFKKYPAFVGLSPFGSVVRGYSEEDSDVDLNVIYDSSKPPVSSGSADAEARAHLGDLTRKLFFEKGKDVHVFRYIDINKENFSDDLKNKNLYRIVSYITTLSRMVTGDKINMYRENAKKKIENLDLSTKRIIIEDSLVDLVQWDMGHSFIMSKRIQDINIRKREASLERLWRKRLEKLWGSW